MFPQCIRQNKVNCYLLQIYVDKTAIWFKSGGADMVSVLWSKSITCSEAGCTWNAMGADLKELLKQVEMHTREAHPPNMRKSTATMTVEENMKKELLRILECPVCLSEFKPPIQVYIIFVHQYWSFIYIFSRFTNA